MMLINSFTTIRRFGLALCISLACLTACNDPEPAITSPEPDGGRGNIPAAWQKLYGSDPGNIVYDIAATEDGGMVLTGLASLADSTTDLYLLKLDASGNQVWEARFGTERSDAGRCVLATSDGGCIAAGYGGSSGGNPNLYIVKVNHDGIKEWDSLYYLSDASSMALDITAAYDGNYIITGIRHPYHEYSDALLMEIDPQGTIQWEKSFGDEGQQKGWSVAAASDGTIALTGESIGNEMFAQGNGFIVITDAGGNLIRQNIYPGMTMALRTTIIPTHEGNFLTTIGQQRVASSFVEGALINLDKEGNEVWRKTLENFSSPPVALMPTSGDTYTFLSETGWLVNVDYLGERQWDGYPTAALTCTETTATTLSNGAIIIAGNTKDSYIGTDSRICVFRIDP